MAQAIAAAAAHPLGVGDAKYRYTETAGDVDTVPFGAFRKELINQMGGFDETLLANEDYEFNVRLRRTGGKVWLNPNIRSTYFSRRNLAELARQYWRYGYWKVRMLRRYPKTIRYRQALPPLFVLCFVLLGALSYWSNLAGWILGLQVVSYALALLGVGIVMAIKKRSGWLLLGVPLAMATMHISWGGAFLWSMVSLFTDRKQ
jgi:GT2 family glycosyltransferase